MNIYKFVLYLKINRISYRSNEVDFFSHADEKLILFMHRSQIYAGISPKLANSLDL